MRVSTLAASLFAFAALALAPSLAFADEPTNPDATPKTKKAEDRTVTVTTAPLRLAVSSVGEAYADVRVHRKISVGGMLGYGAPTIDGVKLAIYEAGAQVIAYPVGHFDHGMQLGAQVQYAYASGERTDGTTTTKGSASGIAPGAFVGYKLATDLGFTFAVQAGAQYVTWSAQAVASNTSEKSASDAKVMALANILVGWSF